MKTRRFILPLTIVLVLAAVVYSVLRPALIRGKARRVLKEFNCDAENYAEPSNLYWLAMDKLLGPSHRPIRSVHFYRCPVILNDSDLDVLRSLPELESLQVPFHDLSDGFLADIVSNSELARLDFSGTYAGAKTVKALLDHPREFVLPTFIGTSITRKDAERLRAAYPEAVVLWSPAMSAAERASFQTMYPAVSLHQVAKDFDFPLSLLVSLDMLAPDQAETFGKVEGSFYSISFMDGELDNRRALSLLKGKETRHLDLNNIELTDSLWMGTLPRLEGLDLGTNFRPTVITGDDLQAIGNLTHLTRLDICGNTIEDHHLEHLLPLKDLERLSLSGNRCGTGPTLLTDACLTTLATFPKLTELRVYGANIRDVDGILALPALKELYENSLTEADRARLRMARPGFVFH